MPIAKEFTIRQEDKPGTLGKLCQALADQNVNILAFQSSLLRKARVRFIGFWTITQRPMRFSINNSQITQRPRLRT
jgi:glycine cleavage system regulatory protein